MFKSLELHQTSLPVIPTVTEISGYTVRDNLEPWYGVLTESDEQLPAR